MCTLIATWSTFTYWRSVNLQQVSGDWGFQYSITAEVPVTDSGSHNKNSDTTRHDTMWRGTTIIDTTCVKIHVSKRLRSTKPVISWFCISDIWSVSFQTLPFDPGTDGFVKWDCAFPILIHNNCRFGKIYFNNVIDTCVIKLFHCVSRFSSGRSSGVQSIKERLELSQNQPCRNVSFLWYAEWG